MTAYYLLFASPKLMTSNTATNRVAKPERPADDDCCGGGCSPCVWDHYHEQLAKWHQQQGQNAQQVIVDKAEQRLYR
jgi:hypothetical protein